jgi:exodeoxyribonuclease VII large subunit
VHDKPQVLRETARPLWIRGEVSGWKRYPSGHCYFTLKDAEGVRRIVGLQELREEVRQSSEGPA